MLTTHSAGTPVRNLTDVEKDAKIAKLECVPFGAPASNPLVEAARKALLNNNPSAVSSTGMMGSETEIQEVQEVVNKDAKLSKLEDTPFGAPASNPLVEAARKALLNNGQSAVSSTGMMGTETEIQQVQQVVNKDAKLSKLEDQPFGADF